MSEEIVRLMSTSKVFEYMIRCALVLAGTAMITGCATLDQVSQQALGPEATSALVRSMATVVYEGQTWNMSYTVSRTSDKTYYLRKLPSGSMRRVGQFLSFEKVRSIQLESFATDVFLASSSECPYRYLLLTAGSEIQGRFTMLGCSAPLSFASGTDGYIYATQASASDAEPLAYRIGAASVTGPYPISTLAGYPQGTNLQSEIAAGNRVSAGSTSGYSGMVWNVAYTIAERPDGNYVIQKMNGLKLSNLGHLLSLTKTYSEQTKTFAVDAFLAPTDACPHQYLLVLGSGNNQAHFKFLGCKLALHFAAGTNGLVYAEQDSIGGATPLAYTITENRLLDPEPITQLVGFPQRDSRETAHQSRSVSSGLADGHMTSEKATVQKMQVPAQAPNLHAASSSRTNNAPAPVTVDLGGGGP